MIMPLNSDHILNSIRNKGLTSVSYLCVTSFLRGFRTEVYRGLLTFYCQTVLIGIVYTAFHMVIVEVIVEVCRPIWETLLTFVCFLILKLSLRYIYIIKSLTNLLLPCLLLLIHPHKDKDTHIHTHTMTAGDGDGDGKVPQESRMAVGGSLASCRWRQRTFCIQPDGPH